MQLMRDIMASLRDDAPVKAARIGCHLIGVLTERVGLAANLVIEPAPGRPEVVGEGGRQVATWVLRDDLLEAGLGMAAINSLLRVDLSRALEVNAKELIASKAAAKNLVVVGHFPFVDQLRPLVRNLWVMEKRPRPGDLDEEQGYQILQKAEVVAMTGSCLINHTFERIMTHAAPASYKIMLGPSTPLTPVLFDYGIDAAGGVVVEAGEEVLRGIEQGLAFRQLRGVRLLTIVR